MPRFHETRRGRIFFESFKSSFPKYVEEECKRQWKENQEDEYGDWESQSDDTKAEYYNQMYVDKLSEDNKEDIYLSSFN